MLTDTVTERMSGYKACLDQMTSLCKEQINFAPSLENRK